MKFTMVATPGTVSEGTLRYEDLAPAFLGALEQLEPGSDRYKSLAKAVKAITSERKWDVLDKLLEALEEHAGPGLYFGSHSGDGALYGFWPQEDAGPC